MIKTFRGTLANGGQNTIRLSTKKGKIGYSIKKFEIMPNQPGVVSSEHIVKIHKVSQTTIDGDIDFADGNLLAAAFVNNNTNASAYPVAVTSIFEQEMFNQDVFITHTVHSTAANCNYYIEIETMTLTDNEAAVSTLRDIRLNPQVGG